MTNNYTKTCYLGGYKPHHTAEGVWELFVKKRYIVIVYGCMSRKAPCQPLYIKASARQD